MAIIRHKSSKNAAYDSVYEYLKYEHERHEGNGRVWYTPVLDEYGLLQERTDCLMAAFDSHGHSIDPVSWAAACVRTNFRHQKNRSKADRKNHTYIISLPESDRPLITKEDLLELSKKMSKDFFRGYEVLIAVHMDKKKNPHFHLVINSVRAEERPEQDWMMTDQFGQVLPCETMSGGKHQDSTQLRRALNDWVLAQCREKGLFAQDNNSIADQQKKERVADKNNQLKKTLEAFASECRTISELQQKLQEHDIRLNLRGNSTSILPSGGRKNVRLTTLGLNPSILLAHMPDFVPQHELAEKKYAQWVIYRREKNDLRIQKLKEKTEAILEEELKKQDEYYRREDYKALFALNNHILQMLAELHTEKEKANRLLSAWDNWRDESLPQDQRRKGYSFVCWSGCDPNNETEYQWLTTLCESIELQEKMAIELSSKLRDESIKWKDHNDLVHLKKDAEWLKRREQQLKHQIKYYKKRSKKLWDISCNCERTAMRRSPLKDDEIYLYTIPPGWENYHKMRSQWTKIYFRQRELEMQLSKIKAQKREHRKSKYQRLQHSLLSRNRDSK